MGIGLRPIADVLKMHMLGPQTEGKYWESRGLRRF